MSISLFPNLTIIREQQSNFAGLFSFWEEQIDISVKKNLSGPQTDVTDCVQV